jgi:hypothetical protein
MVFHMVLRGECYENVYTGVQTIHRSRYWAIDSFYALKYEVFIALAKSNIREYHCKALYEALCIFFLDVTPLVR